jgi:DNA-binding CsgD family transcriptional regulator
MVLRRSTSPVEAAMTRKPIGTPGRRKVPARSKIDGVATDSLESAPRETGIRAMGDMPWGTHICVFYETKNDLLETNASYIEAGLRGNEFCVWAVSEPTRVDEAEAFLRQNIAEFDRYQAASQLEILPGYDWYLRGNKFDPQRITGGWHEKLHFGLSNGFDGMRVSGNAFWMEANRWNEFREYELELDQSLVGKKMIVMCTYSLRASRAIDLLDVTRAHNFTVARRGGEWEFLESPELRQAREEIKKLRGGMDVLTKPFPGHERLTPQERIVLAQVVRGASSKEASRTLGLSPRTVEFHRMNIMQKLGAKNVADLLLIVLVEP